jgi:hypothetical protein
LQELFLSAKFEVPIKPPINKAMKKFLSLSSALVVFFFFTTKAQSQSVSFKPTPETVSGEVIDLNIYVSEGGHGTTVQHWAQDGINHGDPIALLSDDGKVIVLLPNTIRANAYLQLRRMADQHVTVTGQIYLRNNLVGMDVQSFDQAQN